MAVGTRAGFNPSVRGLICPTIGPPTRCHPDSDPLAGLTSHPRPRHLSRDTSHAWDGAAVSTRVTAPLLHDPGYLIVSAGWCTGLQTATTPLDPTAAMQVEGRHRLQRNPCDSG